MEEIKSTAKDRMEKTLEALARDFSKLRTGRASASLVENIKVEYYGTDIGLFEAFKGGALSSFRETNPAKWSANFEFPAVQSGEILKAEIPHGRPSGIEGQRFVKARTS